MVSVIIPYYNRPEKLRRCLASISKQTYAHIEVIVVDDCSDGFPENLKTGIRYHRNTKNLGPGGSRNAGMGLINGALVAFLDCDDYWHPEFLQKCIDVFRKEDSDTAMVYANTLSVSGEKLAPKREIVGSANSILPTIFSKERYWATSSCLWNAEVIKNCNWLPTRCWEDYAFDASVALVSNKIAHVNENLVYYDSTGDDKLSKQAGDQSVLEKSKSVLAISKTLQDAGFIDEQTLNGLAKQVLNSLILQQKYDITSPELRLNNLEALGILKGTRLVGFVKRVLKLPKKISLYLLRKLRRQL